MLKASRGSEVRSLAGPKNFSRYKINKVFVDFVYLILFDAFK